ncbi:TraR/DksA family transcriptional regulator [Neolewinella agarilytica]|uniref:Transcriptional regulator, TraR/DksA family n=1 Tax=Neolewinella agarilytica TaxID=478744 RepID=A0A1H9JRD5_9BACT|nr:TraR/DksA C4-type zinc finger protein [Neolewinella agarilytica]SEQ89397.1 transcriptional regulator, TraR/DksA family [Neolewinella agarilytica]
MNLRLPGERLQVVYLSWKVIAMIDKAQLAEKLAEQISLTEKKIAGYEEMSGPVTPDDAIGRVSRMDAINNKAVTEATLRTARQKLDRLKTMQANLDDPKLGLCKRCSRPIPTPRLLLMPESPFCVRCA